MGFISDVIVSYEYHLGGYESHLVCYEFLEVWCWLKIGLDQTGPIRKGLRDSHVTVGRHVRGITDCEKLINLRSKPISTSLLFFLCNIFGRLTS